VPNNQPKTTIDEFEKGNLSYEDMLHQLHQYKSSVGFTRGVHDPEGSDGYVPGTWDDVRHAMGRGILKVSDYESLREKPQDQTYVAGVIPTARGVIDVLIAQVDRYKEGQLDVASLDRHIDRTLRQLNLRACWCNEDVCCRVHGRHTAPHKRCILR